MIFFFLSKLIHLDFGGIRKTQIWGSWKWEPTIRGAGTSGLRIN